LIDLRARALDDIPEIKNAQTSPDMKARL